MADRDLVERAMRGDQVAFGSLAASSSDRLYAVALRLLRDPDAASDALQTALVQIWRQLPTLREPDRFEGWSYRIVVNSCRGDRRQARRSVGSVSRLSSDRAVGDSQVGLAVRDQLERAFRTLSIEHRAVLVLHHYRDLSVTEIADALDVPVGTVKSRLHHARQAMRAALEADARSTRSQERPA